jgi:circadian clock protein KaiC
LSKISEVIFSGIYGLDSLISGGIRANTISVIIGGSGTGKTIFCLQYLLEGLYQGQEAIFVTMEETPSQLIEEAKLVGLDDIDTFTKKGQLIFIPSSGENFRKFINYSLPKIIIDYRRDVQLRQVRIAIDPLTPLIWSISTKSAQRKLIHSLFYQMKSLGTVIASVEQHTPESDFIIDRDVTIPVFLADNAFLLQYLGLGSEYDIGLRILKTRGAHHEEGIFPVKIVDGWGLIVLSPPKQKTISDETMVAFEEAIKIIRKSKTPNKNRYLKRFNALRTVWDDGKLPPEIINVILRSKNLLSSKSI